jgi:hypothetical protein
MKTAVIDMDSVCYTIGHPNKVLDETGEPKKEDGKFVYQDKTGEELILAADQVMTDILTKSEATHFIPYMKGINTTSRRKKDNPKYKANRTADEPWWWKPVQEYLYVGWNAKYVNDIEVDDAVNITRLKLPDAFICAIDKDLLGLEGTHYNWRKHEWVTVSKIDAEYKFWEDMIAGQPGDNIKGLPGKGPAFARKLLMDPMGVFVRSHLANHTFTAYLEHFGELKGIKEYFANYMSLKILEEYKHFEIPEPIEFKKESVI